jgi:hypothetical protein
MIRIFYKLFLIEIHSFEFKFMLKFFFNSTEYCVHESDFSRIILFYVILGIFNSRIRSQNYSL